MIQPAFCLAFVEALSICIVKLPLFCMITPRSLVDSCFSMISSQLPEKYMVSSLILVFFPCLIVTNFEPFYDILFSSPHLWSFNKSSWRLMISLIFFIVLIALVSSTYIRTSESRFSPMSEMNIKKSTGPSTDPCGTPDTRWKIEDSIPSASTC